MHVVEHFLFQIWWKFLVLTEYQSFVKRNELVAGKYIEKLRKFIKVRKINYWGSGSIGELVTDTKNEVKGWGCQAKIVGGRI